MTENKLEWSTEQRKVNDLFPYSNNPRKLSADQEKSLKRSLEKFNLVEIPAIDTDNTIIAGHQRLKVMQLMGRGEELIDVRIPNRKLTEEEYKQYLITSNAVTGSWDMEKLKTFELDMLTNIGFDQIDLIKFWDKEQEVIDDDFDVSKELKKITKPVTKLGDLITIGKHKILCGSCTDENNLRRLFSKEKTSFIFSDPPYNINLNYSKGLGGNKNYGGEVEDDRTDEEYIKFLRSSIRSALAVANPDCHVFYWNTEQNIWILQTLYRQFNIANKRVCLWIKNGHNPTPLVGFNKTYEPCIYGTRGRPYLSSNEQGLTEVMNKEIKTGNSAFDEINIWTAKRLPYKDYEHATTKPPSLHQKAIKRCSKPGDIILDSFLGSGSTMIASEALSRRVYGCELSPQYCDLIIKRMKKMYGLEAKVEHYEKN